MGAVPATQEPHAWGSQPGCDQGPLTLDSSMLDHADECPVQGGGRGVPPRNRSVTTWTRFSSLNVRTGPGIPHSMAWRVGDGLGGRSSRIKVLS